MIGLQWNDVGDFADSAGKTSNANSDSAHCKIFGM